jgi:hypothetical protein
MRRLARRVLVYVLLFVVACSAMTCVVSTVLWVRGYFVGDSFRYRDHPDPTPGNVSRTDYVLASSRGRLGLAMTSITDVEWQPQARALTWGRDRPPNPISVANPTPFGRMGFQFVSDAVALGGNSFVMVIGIIAPSWFVVGISAIPPGLAYLVWRRRRRAQLRLERGQCVRCGYDLRESPERCPECGAAVSTPAPVQS